MSLWRCEPFLLHGGSWLCQYVAVWTALLRCSTLSSTGTYPPIELPVLYSHYWRFSGSHKEHPLWWILDSEFLLVLEGCLALVLTHVICRQCLEQRKRVQTRGNLVEVNCHLTSGHLILLFVCRGHLPPGLWMHRYRVPNSWLARCCWIAHIQTQSPFQAGLPVVVYFPLPSWHTGCSQDLSRGWSEFVQIIFVHHLCLPRRHCEGVATAWVQPAASPRQA